MATTFFPLHIGAFPNKREDTGSEFLRLGDNGPSKVQQELVEPDGGLPAGETVSPQQRHIRERLTDPEAEGLARQKTFSEVQTDRSVQRFSILSGFYNIHDAIAVQTFLTDQPKTVKLLFAALPKMKEFWGSDTKSSLELLEDPEDDSWSLVVRIQSNHPDPYQALDIFDRSWWLANVGSSDGILNFSVEPE